MEAPSPVAPLDLAPPDELGTGAPPPPSPLSGCYLLIVIGEPYSQDHKDIILQRIAKGFLSWDCQTSLVDLEKELQALTAQAPEGEEAKNGERLIQYATENLVTEVLIHPQINTLVQCVRNLLSSFTRHRHLIHAGYTFAGNGSWILQDGTFSLADFTDAFQEVEVQRVLRAYENCVTVDVHCSPDGDWTTERLSREPFARSCKVRVNPDDILTAGSAPITDFINYISPFLKPASIENLLEPSEVVGNIRFSHPTLYVFPGGQGDAALFGINGFNMLVDGGFARKACFWDFARHLDRLDAVLVTRLNNGNVNGISSVLRRKKQAHVYPQIGHFFCNLQERRNATSPDGDKDRDPLLINLADEGQEMVQNLRQMQLKPHPCYREGNYAEPVNLYHKVGHGKLDMYIISPTKDSREVKEFLAKWNANDARLFAGPKKDAKDFCFPLQNLISICALLVWQPANPNDTITRILFPGSSPQHKIFEGLEKLKHLEFLKFPVCSMKSISPSGSTVGLSSKTGVKLKSMPAVLDKLLPGEKEIIKEASQKTASLEANKQVKSATIPVAPEVKSSKYTPLTATAPIAKVPPQNKNKIDRPTSKPEPLKKTEANKSQDGEKGAARTTKTTEKKTEVKPKPTSVIKSRTETKPLRSSVERKATKATTPTVEKKSEKSSPTTPKKTIESKTNGVASKNEIGKTSRSASKGRPSPTATPAKSAKDANNRKVVESKINVARVSSTARAMTKPTKTEETKQERKPITRKPKASPSPIKRGPGSPAKSSSVKSTPSVSVKSDKDGVISKIKADEKVATDSSEVSTPSTADPDKTIIKAEAEEATPESVVEAAVVQEVAIEVEAKPMTEEDVKDVSAASDKAEDEIEEDAGNKDTDEEDVEDSKETVEEEMIIEEIVEVAVDKQDDLDTANEDEVGDNKEEEQGMVEPIESLQKMMNLSDKRGESEHEEEGVEEDEEYLIVEQEEVGDQGSADAEVGKEDDMEDDGELKKQRDEVESEKENKDVIHDVQGDDEAVIENQAIANEAKEVDSDEGIDIKEGKLVLDGGVELEEETDDKDTKEDTKDEAEDDVKEADTVEKQLEKGDVISAENKEQIEEEVQEIISSAKEIVSKNKLESDAKAEDAEDEEGKEGASEKRKSEEGDEGKEVSSISPEEKMDNSSEKNRETTEDNRETTDDNKEITEDTRDTDQRILDQEHDEYEVKRAASREIANQKYPAEDSQPDEKFSTTVESAATTAPTLPEDERIPLDEIKEIIEEKHVKEETKEKEVREVVIMPRHEQPTTLPQVVIPGSTPIFPPHGVIHHRDIVKTPDEVADLPMHEEVDPGMYESDDFARDFNKGKDDSGSSKKESDELRHISPELDIKGELQLKDEEPKLEADEKEEDAGENVAVEETVQAVTKGIESETQLILEAVENKEIEITPKDEKHADDEIVDDIADDVDKDEEPLHSTIPNEVTKTEVKSTDKLILQECEMGTEKGAISTTEQGKHDSGEPCEIEDLAEAVSTIAGKDTKEDLSEAVSTVVGKDTKDDLAEEDLAEAVSTVAGKDAKDDLAEEDLAEAVSTEAGKDTKDDLAEEDLAEAVSTVAGKDTKDDLAEAVSIVAGKDTKDDLAEAVSTVAGKDTKDDLAEEDLAEEDLAEAVSTVAGKDTKDDLAEVVSTVTDKDSKDDLAEAVSTVTRKDTKEDVASEVAQSNEVIEENVAVSGSEMQNDEPAAKALEEDDGHVVADDKDIDSIKQVTKSFIQAETLALVNENIPQTILETLPQEEAETMDDGEKRVASPLPITGKPSSEDVHDSTQEPKLETADSHTLETPYIDGHTKDELNLGDETDADEQLRERQHMEDEDVKEMSEILSRIHAIDEIQDVVHSQDIHAPLTVSKDAVEEHVNVSIPQSELSATYLDIIEQVQLGETKPNLPSQDREEVKVLDEKTEVASDNVAVEENAKRTSPELETEVDPKEGSQEHIPSDIPLKSVDELKNLASISDEHNQLPSSDIPESNKELIGKEESKEMDVSEVKEKSSKNDMDVKETAMKNADLKEDTQDVIVDEEVDNKLKEEISEKAEKSDSEKGDHNIGDTAEVYDEGSAKEVEDRATEKADHDMENELKAEGSATKKYEDVERITELNIDSEVTNQLKDDAKIIAEVASGATETDGYNSREEIEDKQGEQGHDVAFKEPVTGNLETTGQNNDANIVSDSATLSPRHEFIDKSKEDKDKINAAESDKHDEVNKDGTEEISFEKAVHSSVATEPEYYGSVAAEEVHGSQHEEQKLEGKKETTDILDSVKSTVDSLVSSFTDFGKDLLSKSEDKETGDVKVGDKHISDSDTKIENKHISEGDTKIEDKHVLQSSVKTEEGDKLDATDDIQGTDGTPKRIKEMVTNEASVLDDVVGFSKTAIENIADKITEQAEKVQKVFILGSDEDEDADNESDDEIDNKSDEDICQDDIPVNGKQSKSDQVADAELSMDDKPLDYVKSYINGVESHIDEVKSKLEDAKSHLDEEKSSLLKQSISSDLNRKELSEALAVDTSAHVEQEFDLTKPMGSPKLVFLVGDEKIVITEKEKKQAADEEAKKMLEAVEKGLTKNGVEVAEVEKGTTSGEADKSSVTSTIATSEPEHILKPEPETSQATSDTDSDNAGTVKRMLITASSEDGGTETVVCPTGSISFTTSLTTKPSSDNLTSMLPDDTKEGTETSLEKEESGIPKVNTYDIDGWATDNKLSNVAEDKSDDDTTLDKDAAQEKDTMATEKPNIATTKVEQLEHVPQTLENKDTIEGVHEPLFVKSSRTPSPTKSEPERVDSRASDKCLEETAYLDIATDQIETSVDDVELPGKTTVTTVFTGLTKQDNKHVFKSDTSSTKSETFNESASYYDDVLGDIARVKESAEHTAKEIVQDFGIAIEAVKGTGEELENEIEKMVSTEKVHEMVIDARTDVENLMTETSRLSDLSAGVSGLIASVKKEEGNRSGTPGSDDIDMGGPLSPLSDISSGQASRVPDTGHCDSDVDDDIAESPVSTTSLLANSPLPSHFQYEIGESHSSQPIDIRHTSSSLHYDPEHAMEIGTKHTDTALQMGSSMSSSFYGQLPPDPLLQLLEEREEQEAIDTAIHQSTRDPMTSSFYESREDYTADAKYGGDFSQAMMGGDQNISSHIGGFDDESEDLDFERAMHEHRTARGKDLTPSPTKTHRHEAKFRSNGNDSASYTSQYQHHSNGGQNGKHHDDDQDDFGTERHFDDPSHTHEKVNGKSESHLVSSDSQVSSTYKKETFPTSPIKDVPGRVVTSVTTSGIKHDPIFHSQADTSVTLPQMPHGFGIPTGESSLGDVAHSAEKTDPIQGWGKPLGLPSPAPPPTSNGDVTATNKGTPKKEKKPLLIKKSLTTENNKTNQKEGIAKKRPESPVKLPKKGVSNKDDGRGAKATGNPIYMDLTYVPHHGNSYYSNVEFFKKVRARYYVFSGTEPSREVYNALLEAKQTWDDKELEVTIIPTYDTDTLGYWVAENEDILAKHKIDLSPSASRCTINLQDHETSCSAYRLEF